MRLPGPFQSLEIYPDSKNGIRLPVGDTFGRSVRKKSPSDLWAFGLLVR